MLDIQLLLSPHFTLVMTAHTQHLFLYGKKVLVPPSRDSSKLAQRLTLGLFIALA